MRCCPDQITYFNNKTSTDVPYFGQFGLLPTVTIMYLIDGQWRTMSGMTTQIKLEYGQPDNTIMNKAAPVPAPVNNTIINNIHVDHAGVSTGIIRLS